MNASSKRNSVPSVASLPTVQGHTPRPRNMMLAGTHMQAIQRNSMVANNDDLLANKPRCDTNCQLIAAFREKVTIKPKSSHGIRHRRDIRMQTALPSQEEDISQRRGSQPSEAWCGGNTVNIGSPVNKEEMLSPQGYQARPISSTFVGKRPQTGASSQLFLQYLQKSSTSGLQQSGTRSTSRNVNFRTVRSLQQRNNRNRSPPNQVRGMNILKIEDVKQRLQEAKEKTERSESTRNKKRQEHMGQMMDKSFRVKVSTKHVTAKIPGTKVKPQSPLTRNETQMNAAVQVRPQSLNEDMQDVRSKHSQSPNRSALSNDEKKNNTQIPIQLSEKRWSVYNQHKVQDNLQFQAKVPRDTSGNGFFQETLASNTLGQIKTMVSQQNIVRNNLVMTKAKSGHNNQPRLPLGSQGILNLLIDNKSGSVINLRGHHRKPPQTAIARLPLRTHEPTELSAENTNLARNPSLLSQKASSKKSNLNFLASHETVNIKNSYQTDRDNPDGKHPFLKPQSVNKIRVSQAPSSTKNLGAPKDLDLNEQQNTNGLRYSSQGTQAEEPALSGARRSHHEITIHGGQISGGAIPAGKEDAEDGFAQLYMTDVTREIGISLLGDEEDKKETQATSSPYVLNEANTYLHKQFYTSFHHNTRSRKSSMAGRRKLSSHVDQRRLSQPPSPPTKRALESARSNNDATNDPAPQDSKNLLLIQQKQLSPKTDAAQAGQTLTIPMDMAMLDYQWRESDVVHDHASLGCGGGSGFGVGSTMTESENQLGGLQVKIVNLDKHLSRVNASPRHSGTVFATVMTSQFPTDQFQPQPQGTFFSGSCNLKRARFQSPNATTPKIQLPNRPSHGFPRQQTKGDASHRSGKPSSHRSPSQAKGRTHDAANDPCKKRSENYAESVETYVRGQGQGDGASYMDSQINKSIMLNVQGQDSPRSPGRKRTKSTMERQVEAGSAPVVGNLQHSASKPNDLKPATMMPINTQLIGTNKISKHNTKEDSRMMTLLLEKQSDYIGDNDQAEKKEDQQQLKETNVQTERDVANDEVTPLTHDDTTPRTQMITDEPKYHSLLSSNAYKKYEMNQDLANSGGSMERSNNPVILQDTLKSTKKLEGYEEANAPKPVELISVNVQSTEIQSTLEQDNPLPSSQVSMVRSTDEKKEEDRRSLIDVYTKMTEKKFMPINSGTPLDQQALNNSGAMRQVLDRQHFQIVQQAYCKFSKAKPRMQKFRQHQVQTLLETVHRHQNYKEQDKSDHEVLSQENLAALLSSKQNLKMRNQIMHKLDSFNNRNFSTFKQRQHQTLLGDAHFKKNQTYKLHTANPTYNFISDVHYEGKINNSQNTSPQQSNKTPLKIDLNPQTLGDPISHLTSADNTLTMTAGLGNMGALIPQSQTTSENKVAVSFRQTFSPPKTPVNRHDEVSLLSTSNKSSTLQKMQPRDFGYRMSGRTSDTKFTNKDLAEGGDGVFCAQKSMSFNKLAEQHRREQMHMTEINRREYGKGTTTNNN